MSAVATASNADRLRRFDRVAVDPAPLLRRAAHLPPHDEALVAMVCKGVPQRLVASTLKVAPGTISRRFRQLLRRLSDPLAVALIEMPEGLDPEHQQIGIEHFLLRRSIPTLAKNFALPPAQVKDTLAFIRGWFNGRASRPNWDAVGRPHPPRPASRKPVAAFA